MSARALGRRVADLARRQAEAAERHAARDAVADAWAADRAACLGRVPDDLRAAAGAALADPLRGEDLADWVLWPFAPWATVPAGFRFSRALVEWLLHPPRPWFLGHHCGRCGLGVPLLSTWSNDPNPPTTIVVFPACPACGGKTSYAAHWQKEAVTGECTGGRRG